MIQRAMRLLGALAVLAGFFFAAPAAYAVTCTTYPASPGSVPPNSNINQWPNMVELGSSPTHSSLYYCANGTASSDTQFAATWQAAQRIGQQGTNNPPYYIANVFYQNTQRVYFYENLADLNTHWNTAYSEAAAGGTIYGVTLYAGDSGAPGVPVGSVGVWRKKSDGTTNPTNAIKGVVYHELGHAFDRINGNPSTSGTSAWKTAKDNDIFQLNAVGAGSPPMYGRNVVFQGITIPGSCQTLYNDYGNTTHWQVAQCIWPYYTDNQELYANVFGKRLGGLLSDSTAQPTLTQFANWLTNHLADDMNAYMDDIDWTGWTP